MSTVCANVSKVNSRPLLTLFVLSYNQEQFIHEAVKGAFAQTYSPLEILLSDDCSLDKSFDVMSEMAAAYQGPHRVILNRNPRNLGVGGHFNRIMNLANGELLLAAAGDDISLPKRAQLTFQEWERTKRRALLLLGDVLEFDNTGREIALKSQRVPPGAHFEGAIQNFNGLFGCTEAFSPELFRIFGPLQSELMIEDKPIIFRALLAGEAAYISHPLVRYRRHPEANSAGRSATTLENIFAHYAKQAKQQLVKYRQYSLDASTWRNSNNPNSVPDGFFQQLDEVMRLYEIRLRLSGKNRRLKWLAFFQSLSAAMPPRERLRWLLWLMGIPVRLT